MNALIVEDIEATSNLIKSRIEKITHDFNDIDQSFTIDDAISKIGRGQYDILFLDIQMPNGTTFDLLKTLAKGNKMDFEIIFITGQKESEFIMNAIKFAAIDYLFKPLEDDQLALAISKARKKIVKQKHNEQVELLLELVSKSEFGNNNRIAIHLSKGIIKFFDIREISSFEADGVVTQVVLSTGTKYKAIKNLGYYKSFLLAHYNFAAISQSTLVNVDQVDNYNHADLSVKLTNGRKLQASRRGGKEFRELLNNSNRKNSGLLSRFRNMFK